MTDQENRTQQAPPPWAAGTANRQHQRNPEVTEDQTSILRRYGEEREVADGTLLWNIGDRKRGFFLVLEGEMEIFRRTDSGEHVIVTHGRAHYGGETATISGRGALWWAVALKGARARWP